MCVCVHPIGHRGIVAYGKEGQIFCPSRRNDVSLRVILFGYLTNMGNAVTVRIPSRHSI